MKKWNRRQNRKTEEKDNDLKIDVPNPEGDIDQRKLRLSSAEAEQAENAAAEKSSLFILLLLCALCLFWLAREMQRVYVPRIMQKLKIDFTHGEWMYMSFMEFSVIILAPWIGDSYSGTFLIYSFLIAFSTISSFLLLAVRWTRTAKKSVAIVRFVLVLCEIFTTFTAVIFSIFMTVAVKEAIFTNNMDQIGNRVFSIYFIRVAVMAMVHSCMYVLPKSAFNWITFRFVELALIISVIVIMELARSEVAHKLRFEYQIIEKIALCAISSIVNMGNPCQTQQDPKSWVEYSGSTDVVKQTTKQFFRLMGVLMFTLPFDVTYRISVDTWIHQSHLLRQPRHFAVPDDMNLVLNILLMINLPLSYFVYIPLITNFARIRLTNMRTFGLAHALLLLSLIITYFISLSISIHEAHIPKKQRAIVQLFNGADMTYFSSEWASGSLQTGQHLTVVSIKATGFTTQIINIHNQFYNYSKTMFAYENQPISYTISQKGVFKVKQKGDAINDFMVIKKGLTEVTLINMLNESSTFTIHKGNQKRFSKKVPYNEKKSFQANVKGKHKVSIKGAKNKKLMDLNFQSSASYTFYIYDSNGTVKSHVIEYSRSNVTESWQWIPIYFVSVADSLRFISLCHMIAIEAHLSVLLSGYATLFTILFFSKNTASFLHELHGVGPAVLMSYIFFEAASLIMYIKVTTYIDSMEKQKDITIKD